MSRLQIICFATSVLLILFPLLIGRSFSLRLMIERVRSRTQLMQVSVLLLGLQILLTIGTLIAGTFDYRMADVARFVVTLGALLFFCLFLGVLLEPGSSNKIERDNSSTEAVVQGSYNQAMVILAYWVLLIMVNAFIGGVYPFT